MKQLLMQSKKLAGAMVAVVGAVGCCSSRSASAVSGVRPTLWVDSTTQPSANEPVTSRAIRDVDAIVDPPIGWQEDPRRIDAKHAHLVWKSPSGDTAYGVVLMYLPFPVGRDLVLAGFLNNLKGSDRQARLLSKEPAEDLHGFRFIAESGQYVIRVDLSVRGWRAWAVYAGSLRARAVNGPELEMAERARDRTQVGLPAETVFAE